ncbi:MAG: sulfite exporter TauE/SafE family protein [Phycisphaerales bacterium]|nr:sulfite exporter TauE/SafE family protein [Phycisphaerales bacterium]
MPYDPGILLALTIGCLLAYFLKAFSGFGSALIFVPVVTLLFDARTALASSALVDIVVGAVMLAIIRLRREDLVILIEMILAISLGTAAGSLLAGSVSERLIQGLIAAGVLGLGLRLLLRPEPITLHAPGRSGPFLLSMCVVGGVTGGLVGISGPPIVGAARPLMNKDAFRRRMTALFLAQGPVKLAIYPFVGVWTADVIPVSLAAAIPIGVGMLIGFKLHVRVSERLFSFIVGAILMLLAARLAFAVFTTPGPRDSHRTNSPVDAHPSHPA